MNDQAVEQEIKAKGLTAPRITAGDIEAMMERVSFTSFQPVGTTSTHVYAYLDGQFYLASGHSACVSPENFDSHLGYQIALANTKANAQKRLWELEGYRLYQQLKETK